jgi:hypothetical protein
MKPLFPGDGAKAPEHLCWEVDCMEEKDGDYVLGCWDPESAAREYARDRWSRSDYPQQQTVNVREPDGTVSTFDVIAEPDVRFTAYARQSHAPGAVRR